MIQSTMGVPIFRQNPVIMLYLRLSKFSCYIKYYLEGYLILCIKGNKTRA